SLRFVFRFFWGGVFAFVGVGVFGGFVPTGFFGGFWFFDVCFGGVLGFFLLGGGMLVKGPGGFFVGGVCGGRGGTISIGCVPLGDVLLFFNV
ncbi:hypothetical protein AAGG49_22835, partial [Stenotrophomonas maltophilia]|uniref:hypothetical protein n=1 Tax=Stenotrophomonas maltophilia TaxID=40324 RepID=UPI00313ED9E6